MQPAATLDKYDRHLELQRRLGFRPALVVGLIAAAALALPDVEPLVGAVVALLFGGQVVVGRATTGRSAYRVQIVNTLLGAVGVCLAAVSTGGLASPLLVFTVVLGVGAAFQFPTERGFGFLPILQVAVVAASDLVTVGEVYILGLVAWAIAAVSVPTLVWTSLAVESSYRTRAMIDPLTGCLNRLALDGRLADLDAKARRERVDVVFVMLDLDRFKAVNDNHGHAAGDRVLRATAVAIRGEVRPYDLVYRVGGEEFLVVCDGASVGEAERVAARIVAAVASTAFDHGSTTISAGLASWAPGLTMLEALDHADRALYLAKADGGNRAAIQSTPARSPTVAQRRGGTSTVRRSSATIASANTSPASSANTRLSG